MRILAKGANVTVWRGEGDDGPMEEVLSTTSAPTLTPASMWFISGANAAFAYDDIEIVADGWTSDTTFATNSGNELTSSTFGGVTTTYGYDAWGNLTSKARGSYTATYAWHYGGKLTGVTSTFPGEGAVTYAYGGDGAIRERQHDTTAILRWLSRADLLSSESNAGVLASTLVAGLARIVGTDASTGSYLLALRDKLGSTRRMVDESNSTLGKYEDDPYGQLGACEGAVEPFMFTGHAWESVAGLYVAPYRAYAAPSGRWLSRDPLARGAGNPYLYVDGDPINKTDMMGLKPDNEPSEYEGCTDSEIEQIEAGFRQFCPKTQSDEFNKCMCDAGAGNIVGKLREKCNNLVAIKVKCVRKNNSSLFGCRADTCGVSVPGGRVLRLCPGPFTPPEGGKGCPSVGCTLLHELTHMSGAAGEKKPNATEKCLGGC